MAPAVEPVPIERPVVLSSPADIMPEMSAIGTQARAIAMTSVVPDRSAIVHDTSAVLPEIVAVVADVARVRTDVATIRSYVARIVTHVASRGRNGRLRRDGDGSGCNTESECGQGR